MPSIFEFLFLFFMADFDYILIQISIRWTMNGTAVHALTLHVQLTKLLIFVLGNLIFDQQIFRISRYRWRHKSTFDFVGMWWFHVFLEYFKKFYANILCRHSYSSFEKFRNYLGIVLINKMTQKNGFRCRKNSVVTKDCYVIFFFSSDLFRRVSCKVMNKIAA